MVGSRRTNKALPTLGKREREKRQLHKSKFYSNETKELRDREEDKCSRKDKGK